ncbi:MULTISPECIES: hypothetical protein [unclassified Chryseobacterium]|uniref:hypothetical protein n=1 Tax=unclassified Chryseobacterium TaxID=2593645 RepID=UPI000D338B55|nr:MULTISPECIES: hypothetical protein [unclassified Chryseobacterium]PTT78208.1 hypothetical protein DBR25_00960 [Chryseobacterium sp. HMWF001]PVV55822.1 hypothetical protein DD829_12970 [Chryseobacterium sp. HMWF035]
MQKQTKLQILFTALFFLNFNFSSAQVGIGTSSPNPSAMLEIHSANKGVLFPSVALDSQTDNITITSPSDGLIVWNNGQAGLVETGFFYWNNAKWNMLSVEGNQINPVIPGGNGGNGWNDSATNSGTNAGANTNLALGTNTYDDLIFKVNSVKMGRLGVDNSISFGPMANAGQNGISIGTSSSSFQGVSIGNEASVTANDGLAVGNKATAAAFKSNAIGYNAKTNKNESTAIGNNSLADGFQSTAIGYNSKTTANESSAFGNNSFAAGFQSVALGYNAKTNSNSETAVGFNTVTNGQNSTAIGSGASATGQNSTAIGYNTTTSQYNAIAIGNSSANVGIGTSTPNTTARLDVNGQYKLGSKGTVNKNQISFEVWPSVSINNLPSGKSTTMDIAIPATMLPSSTKATIVVTPASDFAGNASFSISNPRMTSTSNITINLTNISGNAESLYSSHFYVTINEF